MRRGMRRGTRRGGRRQDTRRQDPPVHAHGTQGRTARSGGRGESALRIHGRNDPLPGNYGRALPWASRAPGRAASGSRFPLGAVAVWARSHLAVTGRRDAVTAVAVLNGRWVEGARACAGAGSGDSAGRGGLGAVTCSSCLRCSCSATCSGGRSR
jgi:hypothetical protein